MKWKIVTARTTKITRATTAARHDLEHYCRDLNGWPRSWMGLERDLPPGEQLLVLIRPFLDARLLNDLAQHARAVGEERLAVFHDEAARDDVRHPFARSGLFVDRDDGNDEPRGYQAAACPTF